MLGHLIRKEILDQILSFRFLILSVVGAVVIWLSLYSGYDYYRAGLRDYRLAQSETDKRIQEIDASESFGELSDKGFFIHKSPAPLGLFFRGLEPMLARSGTTGLSEFTSRLKWSLAESELILGVFPPLDLGLVVQVVLSLFVLMFTYDSICGEKEANTLSLTSSFPVPIHSLLLGKLLGTLIPSFLAFGLPLLLGIAAVLLASEVTFTGPEWGLLALILLAFGLYLTTFICAGILSSCLTHRSATSFVVLLAFWIVTATVLPRLSLIVADRLRPAPSIHEVNSNKVAIHLDISEKWRAVKDQVRDDYIAKTGREYWRTPEGQETFWLSLREAWPEFHTLKYSQWDRLDETFKNRYRARLDLAVNLARFSPAFALRKATLLLSGTETDRHFRFVEAFRNYREHLRNEWQSDFSFFGRLKRIRPEKYGGFQWDMSDMPRFSFQEAGPGEVMQSALMDVGLLALWGALFFAGACVVMLRYDLR